MNKLGLTRNFDQLQCCDVNRCKAHLLDIYSSDWSRKTQSVPKLRTYVTFRDSCNVEKYVLLNQSRTERSLLARFRCGILPLREETGRHIGVKPEECLCKICQGGQTEDETHFLLYCAHYSELRNDLLSSVYQEISFVSLKEAAKIRLLMNTYPRHTAKYIRNAFEKRKKFLYVNN